MQEVAACLYQRALGYQTDDLGARDTHAACLGGTAYLLECRVQRRNRQIGHVHRYLRYAVLLDEPADSLAALQRAGLHDGVAVGILDDLARNGIALAHRATLFAHVERDGVGATRRGGVEVVVDRNQKVAGAYGRGSGACHALVVGACAEVGSLILGSQLLGQSLVLARTAYSQIAALGSERSGLVAVGRDRQLVGDALGQLARHSGALVERDARDGDQRQHVAGAHARMRSLVLAHVDKLRCTAYGGQRRLHDGLGFADEGHDRAVGRFARIDVEQFDALGFFDHFGDLPYDLLIASLAEIGDAFDDSFLHDKSYF